MVRTSSDTQTIARLISRNTNPHNDIYIGEQITICSDFQRGDEETGVWDKNTKKLYIDSLMEDYPTGIITLVKDYSLSTSYNEPWKTLDGGNRFRAIRDYMLDKFESQDIKFSELDPERKASFKNINIPCQWIEIQRDDPSDTIAKMFTRLNTSAKPLSQGELIKAHGWKGDIQEIEFAKALIKDHWTTTFPSYQKEITEIRILWEKGFGVSPSETKRCDSLAMMLGYIVSAKESDFTYFDKRYKITKEKLVSFKENKTVDEVFETIIKKFKIFTQVILSITNKSIFGNITKGMPSQLKIAPIWKRICDDTITDEFKEKMINFYNNLPLDKDAKQKYESNLYDGGDGHTTSTKIDNVLMFIEKY